MSTCRHSENTRWYAQTLGITLPHCGSAQCPECVGKYKPSPAIMVRYAVSGRVEPLKQGEAK